MSDLPPGWEWTTIGDLTLPVSKVDPRSEPDHEFDYIDIGGINGDHGEILETQRLAGRAAPSRARQLVRAGDTVLSTVRTYMRKTALVPPRLDGQVASTGFSVLRPAEGVNPKYLYHAVRRQEFVDTLSSLQTGSSYPAVRDKDVRSMPVPLATRAGQERIVAAIEEHLSRLDAAEAATASARRRIAGFYDSVLQATFDPAWPRDLLDSLNDPERPICYGILKPRTPEPGTVQYVEVRSIAKGQIKVGELHKTTMALHQEFRRSELQPGDVTLAIRGSFDRAAVVPQELVGANVSRDVARIATTPRLLPEFLASFLVSPEARRFFRTHARGVAVQGINIGDLRRLPVPSPNVERQQAAIRQIEAARSAIDHIKHEVRVGELRSRQVRHSILAAAFSGQLVPQDPADEPASALLTRIRAEREAVSPTKRTLKAKAS